MVISLQANSLKQGDIRPAYTMIELIFVIVVLGILSAVAIPRLAASRDDAVIVKGKSQVSAIRSGISLLKSKRMLEGNTTVLSTLDDINATGYNQVDQNIFYGGSSGNILEYPILTRNSDGYWMKTGTTTYTFKVLNQTITFTYNTTTGFTCDTTDAVTGTNCKILIQ